MSKVIKLKKGLDIKLNGEAEKVVQPAGKITSCALKPTDFRVLPPIPHRIPIAPRLYWGRG